MCLHNMSGTVRVIKMTAAKRLTASGCIASRWVYRSIVNLLEMPDGKFRDNMHTLTLVKFRSWDSWHSNQPCDWNAIGDCHSLQVWSPATLLWGDLCYKQINKQTKIALPCQHHERRLLLQILSVGGWNCMAFDNWMSSLLDICNGHFWLDEILKWKVFQPSNLSKR